MRTGWTGGQYSLWRVAFAVFILLFVLQGTLDSFTGPEAGAALRHRWIAAGRIEVGLAGAPLFAVLAGAFAAACALLVGWRDRIAALVLVAGLLLFLWQSSAAWAFGGALSFPLLVHAALPSAPYGSLAARGRPDPGGSWRFTPWIAFALRVFLGLGGALVAVTELQPLLAVDAGSYTDWAETEAREGAVVLALLGDAAPEYLYRGLLATTLARFLWLPLALWPRAWSTLFWVVLLDGLLRATIERPSYAFDAQFVTSAFAFALLFDPRDIPGRGAGTSERVFFDGECGLCHRAVRFVLAEDVDGRRFRFAPLQGTTFASEVDAATRATLPDSILVKTVDGRLLARSDAVLHLLAGLGGLWRVLGALLAVVPRRVRDFGYDAVARSRRTWFERPEALCPLLPAHLARRFEA